MRTIDEIKGQAGAVARGAPSMYGTADINDAYAAGVRDGQRELEHHLGIAREGGRLAGHSEAHEHLTRVVAELQNDFVVGSAQSRLLEQLMGKYGNGGV
jgi:hypothetical protein